MRGLVGTARLGAAKVASRFSKPYSKRNDADSEFDLKWGVETSGVVRPDPSAVVGENWAYGVRYQGVNPVSFTKTLEDLPITYREFVFIDFGSGKGRAIILATGFPFKRIIGIEYCEELNRIARENLFKYPDEAKRCREIELVGVDAVEYQLPNEPLVLFFYNPFGQPVMERVVQNVTNSFRLNPRRILIVYSNPEFADLWDGVSFLTRIQQTPAVYDTRSDVECK